MKRMLINATQEEELRVAIVDGQKLYDLDIEVDSSQQKKANIYLGKITRVEPSLDAAFVDYGAERHGFLPLKDISSEYFDPQPEPGQRVNIKSVLREGQLIVVQIDKDERGTKGAALTTFISLAGRFIVLMPNNPRGGGVSRRISGEDREEIRRVQKQLNVPSPMSCIVRTAGIGRSIEELEWDLEYLQGVWKSITEVVADKKDAAPLLIYQDSSPVIRALRDHFNSDIGEMIIDDERAMAEAREFMEQVMPHNLRKLKSYTDEEVPLFTRFQIESQIESAFAHNVNLPSGGSIVIDHTEALVSIDINSARATKGGDIEATALATNLEAADEIARQCRIRDLGGLLVIDFIDMGPSRNQREVENRLRDAVKTDRARVQIGRISRFGLLEMSRQRLRRSLGESAHQVCPRCNGSGAVRSVESLALAILRLVGEEARKERTAKVIAELPVDVATFLLNEKRSWIQSIETVAEVELLLVANPSLETPNYTLRRVRDDQTLLSENSGASYTLTTPEGDMLEEALKLSSKKTTEKPAVSGIRPDTPAPAPQQRPTAAEPLKTGAGGGILSFFGKLFGSSTPAADDSQPKSSGSSNGQRTDDNRKRRSESRRDGPGRGRRGKSDKRRSSGNAESRGGRSRSRSRTDNSGSKNGATDKQPQDKQAGNAQRDPQAENAAPTKKRRRRRRSKKSRNSEQQDGAAKQESAGQDSSADGANKNPGSDARAANNAGKPAQDKSANGNERSPANEPASKTNDSASSSAVPDSGPANAPGAAAKSPDSAASKPAAAAPAKPDGGASTSGDGNRRLPWEGPTPGDKPGSKPGESYTVWSSDDPT